MSLDELKRAFPRWAWLRSVNMFAYVSEDRARTLLTRVEAGEAGTPDLPDGRPGGGGFGDAETNAWVAKAGVRRVTGLLRRRGYTVRSRETEKVGRYISLERLVEEAKEDYYHVLRQGSQRWHEGKHDLLPWLNRFLAIVRRAYAEFEQRAGQVKAPRGAKTELLRQTLENIVGDFTVSELERFCPGISRDHLRRLLKEGKAAGRVTCLGRGPGAKWRKAKEGHNPERGS